MHIFRRLQTDIVTRSYQDKVLVFSVELLEPTDDFQRNDIHAVLIFPENALGLNCNPSYCQRVKRDVNLLNMTLINNIGNNINAQNVRNVNSLSGIAMM